MSSTCDHPSSVPREIEFLITAKTYPHPSTSYDEIVCTGGITASGEWIRLYPLPFRYLDGSQAFKKYQWVTCKAFKHLSSRDPRPESYRPVLESIVPGRIVGTTNHWEERRRFLLPYARQSMEEIQARWRQTRESVGIFKPKEVIKVLVEPDAAEWSQKHREHMSQLRLFGRQPKMLEKVPWRFRYVYRCDDPDCGSLHKQTVRDWEIFQLYRRIRDEHNEQEAVRAVQSKLDELFSERYDTYFIVGSVGKKPSFIIGGLFYPTRARGGLLSLWADA